MKHGAICVSIVLSLSASIFSLGASPTVTVMRTPDGGIQPQVAVDNKGDIHLLYFKGDAARGDLFYVRSKDAGKTFSDAIRVNSQPTSAMAAGTVRGPQITVGRDGRPHVIWMGSDNATPRAPGKKNQNTPLLYSRLNDSGAFEPQRNVITAHVGLDGGISIAADNVGNVYAVWHAPELGRQGEEARRVWVARSTDDGMHFAPETAADPDKTGICGCCGMRAFCARDGALYISFRSAQETVHRDMYMLLSRNQGTTFGSTKLDEMKMGMCVMSTTMISQAPTKAGDAVLAAWETSDRVYFTKLDPEHSTTVQRISAPDEAKPSKHPALATNLAGQTLFVWAEGTGWEKGGSLAWQLFDRDGKPVRNGAGHAPHLPVWSLPATFAKPDGSFVILY